MTPPDLGDFILMESCLCVTEPCSCPGLKVRVPRSQLLSFGISHQTSPNGLPLSAATVLRTAPVVVGEDTAPVSAGLFLDRLPEITQLQADFEASPANPLLWAFEVGWALGKKIDEEIGLSTKLGDLLWEWTKKKSGSAAPNPPPPPSN